MRSNKGKEVDSYHKKYYSEHKDEILNKAAESRIHNKKVLLKAYGCPEELLDWSRVNKSSVTITFKTINDFIELLSSKEIFLINNEANVDIENKILELCDEMNNVKYKNSKSILKDAGFPTSSVLWIKINKGNFTLTIREAKDWSDFVIMKPIMEKELLELQKHKQLDSNSNN